MKRFNPGFSRYLRRAFLASAGYDEADLARPVVGIADTSSDYTTCHRAMPQLVEAVKLSPRMGSFLLYFYSYNKACECRYLSS